MGLRVGLTGGLGSGKSTVAAMFAELGAHVISADELGRQLMEPGTKVFKTIAAQFGQAVLTDDGRLDRRELARLAFSEGRVEELNAIVHPAAIAKQAELTEAIFAQYPEAVVMVESALIFETKHGGTGSLDQAGVSPAAPWRDRFDRLVLVTAPEEVKIARFIVRSDTGERKELEAEARRRLALMIPDTQKAGQCDFVLANAGSLDELRAGVGRIWLSLEVEGRDLRPAVSPHGPDAA